MHNQTMKRMHLYLPEPTLERLKRLSEETGLSKAEIIRRALDGYLEE